MSDCMPTSTLLDAFVSDPAGIPPLCDEPQFAAILEMMVVKSPRG